MLESGAKGVAEGVGGGLEKKMEEVAAFAEDAAEHFGNGKHELAVGDGMADGVGDPCAGVKGAALVAGGAEVAGFAGEGEEVLVAAVGAEESGEAGSEVAAVEEVLDAFDGLGTQGGRHLEILGTELAALQSEAEALAGEIEELTGEPAAIG